MPLYTVSEAARRLGISKTALRGRIHRSSVVAHKDDSGIWLVEVDGDVTQHIPRDTTQHTPLYDTSIPMPDASRDMLIETMQQEIGFLQEQLQARTREVEQLHVLLLDNRRALAATSQSPPQAHETAYESESLVAASPIVPSGIVSRIRRWWERVV